MNPKIWQTVGWVFPSVLMVAFAQIFLKMGVARLPPVELSASGLLSFGRGIVINGNIWIGLCLFFSSTLWWLVVLSKLDMSVAYPLVSLGYVVSVVAAYYVFGEPLTLNKCVGLALIILGVYWIAKT